MRPGQSVACARQSCWSSVLVLNLSGLQSRFRGNWEQDTYLEFKGVPETGLVFKKVEKIHKILHPAILLCNLTIRPQVSSTPPTREGRCMFIHHWVYSYWRKQFAVKCATLISYVYVAQYHTVLLKRPRTDTNTKGLMQGKAAADFYSLRVCITKHREKVDSLQ